MTAPDEVKIGSKWRQRNSGIVVRVLRLYEGRGAYARGVQVQYQSASPSVQSCSLGWFLEAYEHVPGDTPVSAKSGARPARPAHPEDSS